MLIDLHTHTYPKSDDSSLAPEELFQRAQEVGLDGLCLTEHDGFWDPQTLADWSSRYSLLILPGCEVTTEEGHLLVFGLKQYIFGMHRASFVRELVDHEGGAIVVAHPYRRRYPEGEGKGSARYTEAVQQTSQESVFSVVNAVEVSNGRGSEKENGFSRSLAQHLHLPGTGASDAHELAHVGTYATQFQDAIAGLPDLIRALQKGRFEPIKLGALQSAKIIVRG